MNHKILIMLSNVVFGTSTYADGVNKLLPCQWMPTQEQKDICLISADKIKSHTDRSNRQIETLLLSYNYQFAREKLVSLYNSKEPSKETRTRDDLLQDLGLKFKTRYDVESGKTKYLMLVTGQTLYPHSLKNLTVTRANSSDLALNPFASNSADRIGKCEEEIEGQNNYFSCAPDYMFTAPEPGKYSIIATFEVHLGTRTRTQNVRRSIVVKSPTASDTPEIYTPRLNQIFKETSPTVHFENFVSPEYNNSENRIVRVKVFRNSEKPDQEPIYEAKLRPSDHLFVKLGDQSVGKGVDQLEPGSYILRVEFRESAKVRDVEVARDIITKVPFSVQIVNNKKPVVTDKY